MEEKKRMSQGPVMVFAGTTEGYEIAGYLQRQQVAVTAFVATEYGSRSLEEDSYLQVRAGRLSAEEMKEQMDQIRPVLVIDATHPYAAEVTANIRQACQGAETEYLRLLRGTSAHGKEAVYVDSLEEAVAYLAGTRGNVLLTTGSKELKAFTALPEYAERLYARVLSLPQVMTACAELGFEGKHLIGMQGPFSKEMNMAMLRQYDCRYLVTKDTGTQGGFPEKYEAALACGCVPVIIGRPVKEDGLSMTEMKQALKERLGFSMHRQVTLVGIGMGSEETFTAEARKVCEEADVIIGADRMVEAAAACGQPVYREYRSEAIADFVETHPEYEKVAVVLSGDVGFYSGAKKLTEAFASRQISTRAICGISSVVYFMSQIGLSWEDARLVSAHGRSCNLVSEIRHHEKVFAILGKADGVAELARKLTAYDMGQVRLYVGEQLSYPQERIFEKKACELTDYTGDALSVICAVHEGADPRPSTHGLPDAAFIRGKAPMTKEEVRAISLAKLRLVPDAICYDVGAGTGSVSVEMALRAYEGKVYAIEKKPEAAALMRENKKKFTADNLEIIEGLAPEALTELEAPTHAFIGGSSGNLLEIMDCLLRKNPQVRMVINCITLETVTEALDAVKWLELSEVDIVQVSVSRSKSVGRYHMMMGENPIYIITCARGEEKDSEHACGEEQG